MKVISVVNQEGGSGKATTAVQCGAALAERGVLETSPRASVPRTRHVPRRRVLIAAAFLSVVVTGCGGDDVAAPSPSTEPPTAADSAAPASPDGSSAPSESPSASEAPASETPAPDAATPPPPSTPSTPPSSAPPPEAAPAAEVMARGQAFEPSQAAVPVGGTVQWTNALPIRHTVTAGTRDAPQPELFDMNLVDQGATVSITLDAPGSQPYFCRIHTGMDGEIRVG